MITRLTVTELAVRRGERLLFSNVSFELAAGEAMALMGPNGAGKTSLLRAVAGFIWPQAGRIGFVGNGGQIEPDEARRFGVHLVGHQDGLKSTRRAGDELDFQARWTGGDAASAKAAAEALGLAGLLALEVRKLSAGQRRRLALARLLASPRPLWLLDEPMAPLDLRRRALFGELMAAHLAAGGLVLAAAHDSLPIAARELTLG